MNSPNPFRLKTETVIAFLLLGFIYPITVCGQNSEIQFFDTIEYTISDNLGLFESDDLLEISLTFDITYLKKEKPKDEYLDALITIYLSPTDSLTKAIRVRSRGNMRNKICPLPPIRLNFASKDYEGNNIVKNLKLVTHCKSGREFEEQLLTEYLAYKLYNVVTDMSFRTRLLRIKYIDTGSKEINETHYGFIIEPVDMLEERMSTLEIEDVVVRRNFVAPYYLDRFALFQYMIGNTDWDLINLHNIKAFRYNDTSSPGICIVPYDFDYSGLIDAYYAVPNPNYYVEKITDRIYMGPCREEDELRLILDEFLGKRDQFMAVLESFEYMSERGKRAPIKYIESFFNLYNRDILYYQIKSECGPDER
jgi:hypothetical protein